ncbi:MAG: EAL domain-containing protein [Deltaproteobacteria bacterium]|nr:EAL domain-containing protein [Deltaproteobacteria bacterium]
MSVNLSTLQFTQADLAVEIQGIVERAGLLPSQFELEITESAIMPRGGLALRTLTELHALGFSISLDDFGAGYSCLSYLHEFPVTTLKIDRSFVQRIGTPNERPEIVRAIVELAHTLGIHVTAEGVETAEQLARLRDLECERAQGFLFAKPLTAAEAEEFLRSH